MPKENKPGEPPKYRNVTVDADLVEMMNQKANELELIFGFRPTLSQTIRYVLKKETK
jgi:hypothetical protein